MTTEKDVSILHGPGLKLSTSFSRVPGLFRCPGVLRGLILSGRLVLLIVIEDVQYVMYFYPTLK